MECHFYRKRPLFELPQLHTSIFTYFGCDPVLTEVNGILPLTSLGTGESSTQMIFASLKGDGSGERRV